MIIDVEFEELNCEFEADFGEMYIMTDADIVNANDALDECVHGYVTGAGYAENVEEAVAVIEDIGAAIAEKGVELPDVPGEYADLVRSELMSKDGIIVGVSTWTNWQYMFAKDDKPELLSQLTYEHTKNALITNYMYQNSTITIAPRTDTSNVKECLGMYNGCAELEEIYELIFPKSKDLRNLCLNCKKLKRVGAAHIGEYTYGTQMFANCTSLAEIYFVAEIPKNLSFPNSPLSMESVKSIVTHLKNYSGTDKEFAYTVTFKNGIWTEFKATECDVDGYDSWESYVAGIGWNVEEV